MSLSKNSTLTEVFEFIYNPEQDVQVMPVTISKPNDPVAKMMIVIQGKPHTSHVIMANLMTYIQEMYDLAEQKDAEKEIVSPSGEILEDEPTIIIP